MKQDAPLWWILFTALGVAAADVSVTEVQVGQTAVIPCPSNDDDHRFQFWELLGNQIVGPGNAMNRAKYKYEVLSGTLYIKSVSTAEAGFYRCVSRSISEEAVNIQEVELVVKKDWEEVYDSQFETNLYRGLMGLGVVLVVLILGILIWTLKKQRSARFRDMSDEESPNETPRRGTYNPTTIPVSMGASISSQGVDNPGLEADIPAKA